MNSPSCFARAACPALLAAALIVACGGDEFRSTDSVDASAGSPNAGSAGAKTEAGADASAGGKAGTGTGGTAQTGGAAGAGGAIGTGGAGQAGAAGDLPGGSAGSPTGGSAGSLAGGSSGSGTAGNGGNGPGGNPGQGGSGASCADLAQSCSDDHPCCEKSQICGTIGSGTTQQCCLQLNYDCPSHSCCAPFQCESGRCCSGAGVECAANFDCCDSALVCKPFPGAVQPRCCLPTGAPCDTLSNACCSKNCALNPDAPSSAPTCK